MDRGTAEKPGAIKEKNGKTEEARTEEKKTEKINDPQKATEGVDILLGDPRKAVIKLSIPIIVAVHTLEIMLILTLIVTSLALVLIEDLFIYLYSINKTKRMNIAWTFIINEEC